MNIWLIILLCYFGFNALWVVSRVGKVQEVKTPGLAVAQLIELATVVALVIAAVFA